MSESIIQEWVRTTFGDGRSTLASEAMTHECNRLVEDHHPIKYPVRVSNIAAGLGFPPQPIYSRILPGMAGGSLDLASGRIIIRTDDGNAPSSGRELFRARFNYAHEVAHTLFYAPRRLPMERLAPPIVSRQDKLAEEQLCNRGARIFLMPNKIMEVVAGTSAEATPRLLYAVMESFEVNLEPAAYRLREWTAERAVNDRFWMVSKKDHSSGALYCTVCVLPVNLVAMGLRFLAGRQPLSRISSLDDSSNPWSLLGYIQGEKPAYGWDTLDLAPHVETLQTPSHVVRLRSRHMWLKWGSRPTYIWTEGTIKVEE